MTAVPKYTLHDISILEDKRVDPTGVADSTAGIQAVIARAEAAPIPISVAYPPGEYLVTAPIVHLGPVNAHPQALLRVEHGGVGVQFSSEAAGLNKIQARLPSVYKPTVTWGSGTTGADAAIVVDSAQNCEIHVPQAEGFHAGLLMTGIRNVSNTVTLGRIYNNQVNVRLSPSDGGWVNQNTFIGGRFAHFSSSGQNVAGCVQISLDTTQGAAPASLPNNNLFINSSVESVGVAEALIYVEGPYNQFHGLRWENTVTAQRIARFSGTLARYNQIHGGFQGNQLDIQQINGAVYNNYLAEHLIMHDNSRYGVIRAVNGSSLNNPVVRIYQTGTDPHDELTRDTDWTCQITGIRYEGKSRTDTAPQIVIDNNVGRLGMIDTGGTMRWLQQPTGPGPVNWI